MLPTIGYFMWNLASQSRNTSSSVKPRPSKLPLQSASSVDIIASARAHSLPAKGYTPAIYWVG